MSSDPNSHHVSLTGLWLPWSAFLFFWRAVLDEPGDNRRDLCSLPFLPPVWDALTLHLGLATSFPSLDSQMSLSQRPFLTTLILSSPIPLLNLSHHFFQRPSVQFQFSRSVVSDSATPWIVARQASLSIPDSQSLLKLMSIVSVRPSNHLILCHPLLLPPSIFPSIRISSNESVLHIRWPKYRSFSFRICPSNEYSGLISFKIDWLDLLAVQGTLKSLLQHHSSKASIFQCSAFFIVQLSHPYMTTGKTIALTRWTFVVKQCLCFLKCCLGWL